MASYQHVCKTGNIIQCFGTVEDDSNFSVVCDNEGDDGIVADVDTTEHNTWKKVCQYLEENYPRQSAIVEIESC